MAADRERKLRERVAELEADVEWTHPSYNRLLDELEAERAARVRAEEALRRLIERVDDLHWATVVNVGNAQERLWDQAAESRAVLAAVPEEKQG